MDAFEILVVILSALLGIFLVLSIIIAVKMMQLMRKVNYTLEQVDKFTNNLGANILKGVRRNVNLSAVMGAAFTAARKAYKKHEKNKDEKAAKD